jgi:carbon storage regulator
MLVLTRRLGEKIVIGTPECPVTVQVLEVFGSRFKLGIEAPAEVPVHREEVYELVNRQPIAH